MAGFSAKITIALVISVLLAARLVAAEEESSADCSPGDSVPLSEDDLQKITLQVLEKTPLLSSSPGIKYGSPQSCGWSTDIADNVFRTDIIYYPHVESAGIKQAFQVQCQRQMAGELWTCDEATIRRYMQLDSQDFEVRVRGKIGSEEALALIKATRNIVQASVTDGSIVPRTAMMLLPRNNDSYLVTWRSPEGYPSLLVQARLRDGGDPANSEDWQASIYKPEDK